MRYGKWWVEQHLLTSGQDATQTLGRVADMFGDEYIPMLFMTGDGHREPPFQWTTRGLWGRFFTEVVQMNKVCCHVELFSDGVTINSVPNNLAQVYRNGKVFGWEPDIYRVILSILDDVLTMVGDDQFSFARNKAGIKDILGRMNEVGNAGLLAQHAVMGASLYANFQLGTANDDDALLDQTITAFKAFLMQYQRDAMRLRTGINDLIGANIQAKIDQYPDHIHLITCGDAHITTNPLYNFIAPPPGFFGVADQNQK